MFCSLCRLTDIVGKGCEHHKEAISHPAHQSSSTSSAAVLRNVSSVLALVDAVIEADEVGILHPLGAGFAVRCNLAASLKTL
jgi:hypothetical protein